MFKRMMIPMIAAMVAVTLAFGISAFKNKSTESNKLTTSWFQYNGLSYTSTELAKQTNYTKLPGVPSCTGGSLRCAIFANIETVNGIQVPEDDANHEVVFSQEAKED